ncbi:MAG: pitrilysin family protein [Acidobacteriota bacterium]
MIQLLALALVLPKASGETAEAYKAEPLPVEEFTLDNGMTFLLVPQAAVANVAAGWVARVGSADDPPGRSGQSKKLESRIAVLEEDFAATQQEASTWAFLGQFSFMYSELGATGLNANTYPDMTAYFVRIPATRLEGWFWLESDRLLDPVFREFYKEIEIVHEERRIRIDSTPTGALDEEVRRLFWDGHPYAIGPQGLATDLNQLSRPVALQFFRREYRPENLTAVLVGGFDPKQVKAWAKAYFGRLQNQEVGGTRESTPTIAQPQKATHLFEATCECSPQIKIHYPSAAFGQPDVYALDVLAGILNGRTGRLYRDLVLDQEIAFSAFVQQQTRRRAGQFSFFAETKGSASPHDLLEAWDREVVRLKSDEAGQQEIARAINRMSGDAFRSLKDPMDLMSQLLYYQGLGDWHRVEDWGPGIRQVTAADIQRVAREYLDSKARTIALYTRADAKIESAAPTTTASGRAGSG